jgi:hypothetical protein
VPLGDLCTGKTRELLIQFRIPRLADLGTHAIGDFLIDFVSLPTLEQSQITWPITINVGTKEQASTRVPNPTVTTVMLITASSKVQCEAY